MCETIITDIHLKYGLGPGCVITKLSCIHKKDGYFTMDTLFHRVQISCEKMQQKQDLICEAAQKLHMLRHVQELLTDQPNRRSEYVANEFTMRKVEREIKTWIKDSMFFDATPDLLNQMLEDLVSDTERCMFC